MTAQPAAGTVGPLTFLTDTRIITVRNVRRMARTPQMLYFASIQPVVFIIVFRYVFGGAIATPGYSYVNYLMPGLLVEATLFGATTAVALAADLSGGLVDRFRSLPVARPAVLAARTLADFCRTIMVVAVALAVGSLVGFRFKNGALAGAAAIGLVLAFAYAYSWLLAIIGLAVKDPETAQLAGTLFTRPGAEQRIRRLLAIPGQPSLQRAAHQLGVRHALLAGQVRQLEAVVGTGLLRTGPDERLTLTAYGQLFARDVRPALESLARAREGKDSNHRTLPRTPPGLFTYPVTRPPRAVQLQRNAQLTMFKFTRSLHGFLAAGVSRSGAGGLRRRARRRAGGVMRPAA